MTGEGPAPRPSPESWQQVSELLDVAMDLPPEARPAWLQSLEGVDTAVVTAVAGWLAELEAMQSTRFLEERIDGAPPPATSGMQVGAYRLVEPIGQGGMGTVWLAARSDGQFAQRAAVKLLNVALLGANSSEHFAREAGILARLTHPQIAHLLDAGITPSGTPFLVLELVDGEHIDRYCDARRLSVRDRVRVFLDVLPPVAHAHANLVVHRDLKLSNVLVTREGHVQLLDFGIAKLLPSGLSDTTVTAVTREGALTPACAAPEQLTGGPITTRTDVYALGVLLYQLLTGRHPSAAGAATPAALVSSIVEKPPTRASDAAVEAPLAPDATAGSLAELRRTTPDALQAALAGDLDTILAAALKKDPAERYASVTALGDDLRRYLDDQPIAARPDSIGYIAAKFVRRHRMPVALAALALVALVAGLVGTISQARRATAEARAAQQERTRADGQAAAARAQRDFARRQLARTEALNDLNAFLIADAAPVGASFTARDLLVRAEQIVSRQQDDDDDVRVEVLVALGRLYAVLGETTNAGRVLSQAYAASRSVADVSVRAQASCALATSVVRSGELSRAGELLDEGLRTLPDDPQYVNARVFCHLCAAGVQIWSGESGQAVDHVLAADQAANDAGATSPLLRLRIGMELAEALRNAGRFREANDAFADAHRRLVAMGREDTERAGTLLNNWGLVLSSLGRPREAEQMFRRSAQISTGGPGARVDPVLWNNLAQSLFELGRIPEAISLSTRARREALRDGDTIVADQALLSRSRFHVALGELEVGERLLNQAEAHFATMFPRTHAAFVAVDLDRAQLALERGRLHDADTCVERAFAVVESNASRRGYLPQVLRRRAAVAARLGRFDLARDSAERAIALTEERVGADSPSYAVGLSYMTLGEVLAAEGRPADARRALNTAAGHFEATVGTAHRNMRRVRVLMRRTTS